MTYRGHIRNGVAVLDDNVRLPEGSPVVIQPAEVSAFWDSLPIEELARRQQVRTPTSTRDLQGDWPEGDSLDEFMQAVREGRH